MTSTEKFERALKKYGQDVEIYHDGAWHNDKAFIQVLRYKNKMYLDDPLGSIGKHEETCYVYMGSVRYDFTADFRTTRIAWDGYVYGVKIVKTIHLCGNAFYVWAIIYRVVTGGNNERR